MEQQIHFCTTDDGVRIAYATVGEGPPLVKAANWLNHLEFDWRSPIWRHLLQEFSRDHLLLRYDERGNGLSDWNVDDLTFDAFVQDLESVVDAVGLDRFPILGISQGGPVAIAYAVRHPEKVSHLVLYGTYARGFDLRESSAEEIDRRQAELTLIKVGWGQDNPAFRQLWTTLFVPDATPEEWDSFNDLHRVSTSPENAVRLLNEFGRINVLDLLSQVKVPTLVMHCRDESVVPFEEGRLLAARIPGARFVPLEGKNHLLLEADPAWTIFVGEIRRFLGTALTTPGERRTKDGGSLDQSKFTQADLPKRYSILSLLGAGGMGDVYLAEDNTLSRKVALKTLPVEFTNDKDRLRRFQQEARAASALNHPNILTIHEIGAESGAHFIATEFVDGETLRAKLNRGRIKLDEALDVAQQTAFALTAAHGAGILHRDIKPENIMVRHDGIVKVLDFGLAKLLENHVREMIDPEADTRALLHTEPGKVMGTPAYMSPEQARGLDLDARTDIWSQGVVLYEMVAGRAPFRGDTSSHTIVSILETEPPPLATFAPDTPAELQRIVRKALTKDRDSRYQTARDLMIDLKSLRRDLDIQSEMKRSTASGLGGTDTAAANQKFAAKDSDVALSEQATSLAEPRATAIDARAGDGSIRYRVTALIAMLILAIGTLGVWYYLHQQNGPPAMNSINSINSIAVMPFANASGNSDMEYLSDGMTESLITSLSQLPNLSVKARTSVFRYKGKDASPQQVGKDLNVQAIVNGRVVQRGNDLTLHIELVDVSTETALWSGDYNRSMTNLVSLQSEIARDVSNKLQLKLSGADEQKLAKNYTANTEAYQLYLRGRYQWNKRTPEGLKKSIEYFQQSIGLDPRFALAYSGESDAYALLGYHGYGVMPPGEAMPQAKAAALKALEIDNTLAEAHTSLANIAQTYDWDWARAEQEYRQALRLNPNYPTGHQWYGGHLIGMGRFDESIAEMKQAQRLDPLSLVINQNVAWMLYYARRYDEAIVQCRQTLEIDPNFYGGYWCLGINHEQQTQYDEAIADFQRSQEMTQGNPLQRAWLAHAYAIAGRRAESRKLLNELLELRKQRYFPPYFIAIIYAGLGEKDRAFEWLEKAYAERSGAMTRLNVDPVLDPLRSDPRFADLLRRVGVPQ